MLLFVMDAKDKNRFHFIDQTFLGIGQQIVDV